MLAKPDGHVYVFCWRRGQEPDVALAACRWADNPRLNFTASDAAFIAAEMNRLEYFA
ncbi:MAG TPA: hypothetical protein VGX76_12270 [Pirellulales bacterium]|nr:hypothetical protein [Pirellulales bacterium]